MSIVLFPDAAMATSLERLTNEAVQLAGSRQFHTGLAGSVHFTVRALEHYRESIPADDAALARYCDALTAAGRQCGPIELHVHGLTLTSSGVMACATPTTGAAARFRESLASALGCDGWRETNFHRDIWYAMLLHFADDIADPAGLVDWVARRRILDVGCARFDSVHLTRFHYRSRAGRVLMQPEVLGAARLGEIR